MTSLWDQIERTNGYRETSFLPLQKFPGLDDMHT
jgi:hypothetical protein